MKAFPFTARGQVRVRPQLRRQTDPLGSISEIAGFRQLVNARSASLPTLRHALLPQRGEF